MSDPYQSLYVHLVWATAARQPTITADIEGSVYRCLHAECDRKRASLLAIGGTENHVHLLVTLPATLTVADLVKQIKGSSSHFITHELKRPFFRWQGAYGAFSIHYSSVPRIQDYIRHQKEHHRDNSLIAALERTESEKPSRPRPDSPSDEQAAGNDPPPVPTE